MKYPSSFRASIFVALSLFLLIALPAKAVSAPVLNVMVPNSGPSSGGTLVTLTGSNFGTNGTVIFNGNVCTISSYTDSQIEFFSPAGQGTDLPVYVNVNGENSGVIPFNYNPPFITDIFPTSAPTAGGAIVTLAGSSFGTSGNVLFNGNPCAISSYTHSQIQFVLPPGQGIDNSISVMTGGQPSNIKLFNYQAPSIHFISHTTGPTTGGITITVNGNNFGTNSTIVLGDTPCNVTFNSHTSISFTLPPGQGSNLSLVMNASGQSSTLVGAFSYTAPNITSHTPNNGPTAGGTTVYLSGTDFGISPNVTFNGQPCDILSSSHTQIAFVTPPGQGLNQVIRVNVAGQLSNVRLFSYDPPVLNSINPAGGPSSGGTLVTLSGGNFGIIGTVFFNGQPCTISSYTHSQIQFFSPSGVGTGHTVSVSVGGQDSGALSFNYNPPFITDVFPTSAPTSGNTLVTLTGASFGTSGTVLFNGNPCAISSYTHSQIQFVVPPGQGMDNSISVVTGGQPSNMKLFNYSSPSVLFLSPANGPTSGGTSITVSGENFGTNAIVTVAGSPASITLNSHTAIQFILPAGQGVNVPVIITAGGQSSTPSLFNYDVPVIHSLSPTSGFTSGGTLITLNGSNFGTNGSVTVDGNPCVISSYTHTQIQCLTPTGTGTDRPVTVSVSGQASNSKLFTYLLDPYIIAQPLNQTVFVKGSATFSVVASGSGSLSYQWQKVNGATTTSVAKATSPTLVFPSVSTTHAGNYQVVVTSGGGSIVSDAAVLTVENVIGSTTTVAGQHTGLFFETNQVSHRSSGFFQAKVTTNAACSGKLLLDGDVVSFSGKVNPQGVVVKSIARTKFGKSPITLTLSFDLTNGTEVVSGVVDSSPLWTALLTGDRNTFSKTNPATDFPADYTLIFASQSRVEGMGRAVVKANGTAGMTMNLRDGFKTKQGSIVSKEGNLPMYAFLYPGIDVITNGTTLKTNRNYKGSLLGWILLSTNEPTGTASWIRTGAGGHTNGLSVEGWR
ncbi:MAG: IPT/TIG domain-containing protein [Verrucomicrobia bacterium]|nr:IPT/TIG domain-containing protein [Verrucomicrobiota bacterium]